MRSLKVLAILATATFLFACNQNAPAPAEAPPAAVPPAAEAPPPEPPPAEAPPAEPAPAEAPK
jgi:hypothetical protein